MARSHRLKALVTSIRSRAQLTDLHDPAGDCVVALSGGADSAALAWLVYDGGEPVRAIHVHHGWRASDAMCSAARAVAEHIGMGLDVIEIEVPAGASPEAHAREARYAALLSALGPHEMLMTAHTLDDQAETVLANAIRGTGLDGLVGIHRKRGRLSRPLLDVGRSELRELAVLTELPFKDDPSNVDLSIRRNLIRHRYLGELERTAAPGVSRALARLAYLVSDEIDFLDSEAERRTGGALACPVLQTLPVALERRAIRRAALAAGATEDLRLQDVEAVRTVVREGGETVLPGGVVVRRVGTMLAFDQADGSDPDDATSWSWLGTIRWSGWSFEGHVTDLPPNSYSLSAWSEVFDLDELPSSVLLRAPGNADRIRIRAGTKPVGAAFADAGIDARTRAGWPVLADGDNVLWIPGVRRAATGWVGPATRRYLCVSAVQEDT